jgi:hypothetical protein
MMMGRESEGPRGLVSVFVTGREECEFDVNMAEKLSVVECLSGRPIHIAQSDTNSRPTLVAGSNVSEKLSGESQDAFL